MKRKKKQSPSRRAMNRLFSIAAFLIIAATSEPVITALHHLLEVAAAARNPEAE